MGLKPNLKLGALGGPNTFGGDAAREIMALYPEFATISYFRTAEDGFDFANGGHDAMCAPQQMGRTGFHAGINAYIARPDSKLYVICDVVHAYHCALLLKPGADLEKITEVRGHTGSITQSRHWIEKNLPHAQIHIVHTSTHEAAREVALGDGTIASVGTPGMAQEFGLVQAVSDIDGGSSANYWAISPLSLFHETPDRVVVSGRFHEDGSVGRIVRAMDGAGYELRSVFTEASGERLYEYDYVLWFGGKGELKHVMAAVFETPGARLAGAYEVRP